VVGIVFRLVSNGGCWSFVGLSLVPRNNSPLLDKNSKHAQGLYTRLLLAVRIGSRVSPCRLHVGEQWEMKKRERAACESGRVGVGDGSQDVDAWWLAGGGDDFPRVREER